MGDWREIMKNKFCLLHGSLSWFETSPTFPANQCTYKGVSLLKEVFPIKKNSAFLVLQVSGTLKYSVSCNLELRVAAVSFV